MAQLKVSFFSPWPIGRICSINCHPKLSIGSVNLSFIQQLSSKMFTSVIHCHLDGWECHLSLIEQLSSKMFTSVIHCHLDGLECHLLSWEYELNDCHPFFIQVVVGSVNCIYHLWMEFIFFQIDVVECWRWIKLCKLAMETKPSRASWLGTYAWWNQASPKGPNLQQTSSP